VKYKVNNVKLSKVNLLVQEFIRVGDHASAYKASHCISPGSNMKFVIDSKNYITIEELPTNLLTDRLK